jgi:hypothetical protein
MKTDIKTLNQGSMKAGYTFNPEKVHRYAWVANLGLIILMCTVWIAWRMGPIVFVGPGVLALIVYFFAKKRLSRDEDKIEAGHPVYPIIIGSLIILVFAAGSAIVMV